MTLNCPFPAGSGREQILGAFREKFAPRMDEFRPDLVLISAGFDSRIGDPLGRFVLTDADFADLTDAHAGNCGQTRRRTADLGAGRRLRSDGLHAAHVYRSHAHSLIFGPPFAPE